MLTKSRNLKFFKAEVGHLNHFLITIEVGLKNIDNTTIIPADFSTSWNPRDYKKSVERSEIWARKSALTYICSAIEGYFENIFNVPSLIQDSALINSYMNKLTSSGVSPTISWKFKHINNTYGITTYEKDLVQLMILWRNGLVHNLFDFCTHPDYSNLEASLRAHSSDFYNNHCHLDINILIDRFKNKKIPTFKETTSMVKASINYISELDKELINHLDKNIYINDCIYNYIKAMPEIKKKEYFMYRTSRKVSYLYSVLCQYYAFEDDNTDSVLQAKLNELAAKNEDYFS
jgi:hypothetical protein